MHVLRKSQIAIEYAYKFQRSRPHSHVFWVYAATATSFTQAYQDIARKLMLPGYDDRNVDQSRLVAQWLEEEDSRWLMILDNVDNAKLFSLSTEVDKDLLITETPSGLLNNYLPTKLNLHKSLIVTTRSRTIGSDLALGERCVEVKQFSTQQAKDLLQKKLKSDASTLDQKCTDQLVEILGHVPLAITQAAAFIRRNRITLPEYCIALAKDETNLMEFLSEELQDARRRQGTFNSVYRTWKISFDYIHQNAPQSARLLSLIAMFDHQHIPEIILRQLLEKDVEFSMATGMLDGYSLITKELSGKTYAIHPLVRASIQYWLQQRNEKIYYMRLSLQILANQFPEGKYENKDICESLLTHAQVVLDYEYTQEDDLENRGLLLYNIGWYYWKQGGYISANRLVSESYNIHRKILGETAKNTLNSLSLRASILKSQGNYKEAEEIYRRILKAKEKALGLKHKHIRFNRFAKTLLIGKEKMLEVDHPDTLTNLNNLAGVLKSQGQYQIAEEMYRRALKGKEKALGVDHPHTLTSLNNLAYTCYDQGRHDEAIRMMKTVVEKRNKILGADHPYTIGSTETLAEWIGS